MSKKLILFLLSLLVFASSKAQVLFSDNRLGKVVLRENLTEKTALVFNEQVILNSDEMFHRFDLKRKFELSDRTILVIAANGDAEVCPTTFYIMEIFSSNKYKLTNNFGSCSQTKKIWKRGGTIFITMPEYIQWPNTLTNSQINKLRRTEYIYFYKNSKLSVLKNYK